MFILLETLTGSYLAQSQLPEPSERSLASVLIECILLMLTAY